MGERKVLNKYYPPDFDPAKIPRRRQPNNQQMEIRTMLPMSVRCKTCGNYMSKGTKFNSRKEDVIGKTYLGIQVSRFYFKCTNCSAEITYKTDPQNSDYVVESGASRNFEPWRNEDESADKEKRKRDEEEVGDAMKSRENRTLDSKRVMDILATLDELKSMKSRHASVSVDAMLEDLQCSAADEVKKLEEEDEALIKSVDFQKSQDYVHRINDEELDDEDEVDDLPSDDAGKTNSGVKRQKGSQEDSSQLTDNLSTSKANGDAERRVKPNSSLVKYVVVSKKNPSETANDDKSKKEQQQDMDVTGCFGLQSLCSTYINSDED